MHKNKFVSELTFFFLGRVIWVEIIESRILIEGGLNPEDFKDLMDFNRLNPGAQAPEPIS
jgi:hypothetical protein